MRIGFAASIILHLMIVTWVIGGLVSAPSREPTEAIPVELVQPEAPKDTPKKPAELRIPKLDNLAASHGAEEGANAAPAPDQGQTAADKPEKNPDKGQAKADQAE